MYVFDLETGETLVTMTVVLYAALTYIAYKVATAVTRYYLIKVRKAHLNWMPKQTKIN